MKCPDCGSTDSIVINQTIFFRVDENGEPQHTGLEQFSPSPDSLAKCTSCGVIHTWKNFGGK
jgi:uncharacterized Zn finger protein